jgi:acyl-coenzyme A thioesterase PaaI-like protein
MNASIQAPKTTRHLEQLRLMGQGKHPAPPIATLEDDESFTTLDLTTKFFKPIWSARLRATAQVVKRTRTLGLIECDIEDDKGSLVAKVWSSCMVLRGKEAAGR